MSDDIDKLLSGFQRFRQSYFDEQKELFQELKQGQKPKIMVVACSDSRVDPAIVTNSQPGDLFVVRNVANLVPPYEIGGGLHGVSTALEFAVCSLNVEHIVVIGHRKCGGIHALMHGAEGEFISRWVNIAARAKEKVLADMPDADAQAQLHACEEAAILVSLENLMTFPWIRSRVEQQQLSLHGWCFDIEHGQMSAYRQDSGQFETLT